MLRLPGRFQRGTAFLEIIISVAVLALLVHGIATLVIASYEILGFSRTRITARHLANEKIELLRNLPYSEVAVAGGIPAGNLPQLETILRNGLPYTIRTNIVYVDDPFDGLAPADTLPTDYKRVRVDVSWTGTFTSSSTVTLITDIAQRGVEATGGGGTLSILVFDAQGQPVTGAQVRIQNSLVNPPIDLTVNSDSNGLVVLPGSPACFECYQVDVSKTDYSSDRTYSASEVTHPDKPLATVNEQLITEISFAIDKVATLTVISTRGRDDNYVSLGNQFFQLTGGKLIGTDTVDEPVYKYDELLQTDGSGSVTLSDMEWDVYRLTVPASGWDLAGSNPLSPLALLPDSTSTLSFASVSFANDTLLAKVVEASGSGVAEAFVQVTGPAQYDEVLLTGDVHVPDFGQAFFSPLKGVKYNVEATKSGYQTTSFEVDIAGTMAETIILNRE